MSCTLLPVDLRRIVDELKTVHGAIEYLSGRSEPIVDEFPRWAVVWNEAHQQEFGCPRFDLPLQAHEWRIGKYNNRLRDALRRLANLLNGGDLVLLDVSHDVKELLSGAWDLLANIPADAPQFAWEVPEWFLGWCYSRPNLFDNPGIGLPVVIQQLERHLQPDSNDRGNPQPEPPKEKLTGAVLQSAVYQHLLTHKRAGNERPAARAVGRLFGCDGKTVSAMACYKNYVTLGTPYEQNKDVLQRLIDEQTKDDAEFRTAPHRNRR